MGLVPIIVQEMFKAIQQIKEMGNTILFVEQNANIALSHANNAHVTELGKIVLSGSGTELLQNSDVEKAYLGL
ncbi:MAG TPA: hypothetical protein VFC58_03445 [Desulfosporosinus sp.]|nr:hypothetical protein [Desulfosporosinus sp.]